MALMIGETIAGKMRLKLSSEDWLRLWDEYKEVRKSIDLPVNRNEEKTILNFFFWLKSKKAAHK